MQEYLHSFSEKALGLLHHEYLLRNLLPAVATLLVARLVGRLIRRVFRRIFRRMRDLDRSVEHVLCECAVWAVYLVAFVAALSFLGVNTTGVLAALSAAGLALGLALRDTLGNVAGGLQILLLRPFATGDYIQSGTLAGTAAEIGLFATRLKTFDGLFVNVPNGALCNTPLTNFSRNPTRRLDVPVGISYSDSVDAGLRALLKLASEEKRLLDDPAPQALVSSLDDSSVTLVLRVWVRREDYWPVRNDLTRAIKLAVEAAGLTIPFPQRDVHLIPAKAEAEPRP